MMTIMFRGAYYPIDYYYYENKNSPGGKSIYGTDSSDLSNSIVDGDEKEKDTPDEGDLKKNPTTEDKSCQAALASAASMMDDVDVYEEDNDNSSDNKEVGGDGTATIDRNDTSEALADPFDCGAGIGGLTSGQAQCR